jgi:DNA-binding FadR family transcriptional regulator
MTGEPLFRTVGSKDRLVDRVVNNIQGMIVDGQLAPGTRLPPEREFAEQIGVSRTVVREAVRILVAKGLLETRHGIGTVVRQVTSDQISEPLNLLLQTRELSFDHLHQVRTILEVGIVRLAAASATADEIAALEQNVAAAAQCQDDMPAFVALDDAFHERLARTTHNPLLLILAESIGAIMHQVRLQVHPVTTLHHTTVPDHSAILRAIAARDADVAAQAMLVHLEHARRFQSEYQSQVAQAGESAA